MLTYLALAQDRRDERYKLSVKQAARDAERVKELARERGIPLIGAVELLRADALTQGPKLFARNCASCHRYNSHNGLGEGVKEPQSAADLKGFGSREWCAGVIDPQKVAGTNYLGGTKFAEGKMVKFVRKDAAQFTDEQRRQVAAALSAEAQLPAQSEADKRDAALIEAGRQFMTSETARCTECHQFRKKDEEATAPDLTGYASRAWLVAFLHSPQHERFYGKRNDRMPAFGEEKILDQRSIELLADWLRGGEEKKLSAK
jgi:ubiquinol-cytochrome c reductase cytochrome b subunit